MRNKSLSICSILLLAGFLSGCSVGMALSGKKDPNLSVVQPGADKSVVEMQLGSPASITTLDEGKCLCEYEYEVGNEPSAGRAIAHGVLDVVTLGIWEIVGTPVEGVQGEKRRIMITYNAVNKVEAIGAVPPKPSEKTAEQKEQN